MTESLAETLAGAAHLGAPRSFSVLITFLLCSVGFVWAIRLAGEATPYVSRAGKSARARGGIGRGPLGSNGAWLTCVGAYLLTGWIAFDAGSTAMSERLRDAMRDGGRAVRASGEGIRIAEARVGARRQRVWGQEIELFDVVATDSGSALPARLLLRLADEKREQRHRPSRGDQLLWPGANVRVGIRIAPLYASRNPGSIDRERDWARRGIAARGRLADPDWVVVESFARSPTRPRSSMLAVWRAAQRSAIGAGLASLGDASGLTRALSLGDRTGLALATRDNFRRLGLSHLLAVSGLHIGMVAGLLGWLGLRVVVRLRPRPIDPFPAVFLVAAVGAGAYAWIAGGSVSATRAWCCLFVVGVLALARRSLPPVALLSGIALVLWASDAAIVFELGFQLSFAACLGLVVAGVWQDPMADRPNPTATGGDEEASLLDRFASPLVLSLRLSCAAGFGTAWVMTLHGMQAAFVAPLANAIAVPWTAFLVLPASFLAACASAVAMMLGDEGEFASHAMWTRIGSILLWPAETLVAATEWSAAQLDRISPIEIGTSFLVPITVTGGLLGLRAGKPSFVIVCWLLTTLTGGVPQIDDDRFNGLPRVWFFDVGQGDAALIEGREASMLIDTGPGAADGSGGASLVRSLHALGHRQIDLLVVTHADLDHRGGAMRVLESLDVGALWLPEGARDDPVLEPLVELARDVGTRVSWRVADPMPEILGDLRIESLWPPADGEVRSRNAGSLVLRVEVGGRSFLFLADVDAGIESGLQRDRSGGLHADYLKVSHHGSRGGTQEAFLTAVDARHAIVSAPCLAGRGLPNGATLDRIRGSSTRLWWTGREGAIAVFPERAGKDDEVVAWAPRRPCPG